MSVIRRIFRAQRILVMLAFTLASCGSPAVPAATPTTVSPVTLRVYATTAAMPLVNDLTAAYMLTQPLVNFDVGHGNFDALLARVRSGDIPYFISNHLPPDFDLWAAPVGQDGIAVITHPDNPVSGLSTVELRTAWQGRETDWSAFGGNDLPIHIYSRETGSGTRWEFENQVLGDRRTTLSARIAPSSTAMITSVSRSVSAIGYVSFSHVNQSVRALPINGIEPTQANILNNTYPLRTFMYFVGMAEPQDEYRAFIGWVQSPEGQAVVARRYTPLFP